MYNRIKGTQDILDLTLVHFLLDSARKELALYNFTEIETPILEPADLFKRSLGQETDVISKEMYLVKDDEEEAICLRPEVTASIARAFVNNAISQVPWKVFLCGPMFRHERPQKGRFRQFSQIDMEIIGAQTIDQDIQFLKMLDRLFSERLKLDTYGLLINFLGCAEDRQRYKKTLRTFLDTLEGGICSTCVVRKEKNILRVFDCKNEECITLFKTAPRIADNLCEECDQEWSYLRETLEQLSVSYSYKPTLVRGLDYYDKTVFEFVSSELGAQNAFCGGGRYNRLIKEVGAKEDQPSLGASIGVERVVLLLERIQAKLTLPLKPALHVIIPVSREQRTTALLLADELQSRDICTDVLLNDDSIKSMMRTANKMGAKFVLLIGPDELAEGVITVKNMLTGTEEKVAQKEIAAFLAG